MATTSRLSLRYPVASDTADVPRDIGNLASDIDKAAIFSKGVFASRPVSTVGSPGIDGRYYFATDTSRLYLDTGTSWVEVASGTDSVTSAMIAADAVDSSEIKNGAVTSAKLDSATIVPLNTKQLFHVQDEKSSGTDGGTFTSGAWRTRTLNTSVTNTISGASLSSNQMTLPAGTYWVDAHAPAQQVNGHKAKLYNTTTSADVIIGTSELSSNGGNYAATKSFVRGSFTLAAQSVLELQHRCTATNNTYGFGGQVGVSATEVYSQVVIWKV